MPRFVVLEHSWYGTHWDLMLEVGPVLRTWAIDAPIVAGTDLPARGLADHRRAYLAYEGEITGGRGVVRRWDAGEFVPRIWTEERVRIDLAGVQLVGPVELRKTDDTPLSWTFRFGKLS